MQQLLLESAGESTAGGVAGSSGLVAGSGRSGLASRCTGSFPAFGTASGSCLGGCCRGSPSFCLVLQFILA